MKYDFKEEDYKQHIKERCCICDKFIGYGWKQYLDRGNWCAECNAKVNKEVIHNPPLEP